MARIRKTHGNAFKFKVAMEAASSDITVAEMCSKYGVASTQISTWKQQLISNGHTLFGNKKAVEAGLFTCTLCGACKKECPLKIDTPKMIMELRNNLARSWKGNSNKFLDFMK